MEAPDYITAPTSRGFSRTKNRAFGGALLEVCFESLYSGQADFAELWREIPCYGYRFVAMQGLYYPPGSAIARSGNVVFAA